MTRKRMSKDFQCTASDHRPMIPKFRQPGDTLDSAVREVRRRYDEKNPNKNQKWR